MERPDEVFSHRARAARFLRSLERIARKELLLPDLARLYARVGDITQAIKLFTAIYTKRYLLTFVDADMRRKLSKPCYRMRVGERYGGGRCFRTGSVITTASPLTSRPRSLSVSGRASDPGRGCQVASSLPEPKLAKQH
jgi:hypothetical protein